MIAYLRAALAAAFAAVCVVAWSGPGYAADKPFQNADLAKSATELEAQIRADAGTPGQPLAQLRRNADAAFAKNDFRTGMTVLSQIAAAAPNDAANWLRLARTVMQIYPPNDQERAALLNRASAAAYLGYQRATSRNDEADALLQLGNVLAVR